LKADKAEKSKIDSEVTLLLSLKKQLSLVDGSASNTQPGDGKQLVKSSNDKKSNAKASRKGK
jgi:WHEP-TRS domain